jgi:hypothetical protein
MNTEKLFLFSKKYGVILWLPEKTGSTHCWSIMSDFEFKRYTIDLKKQIDYGETLGCKSKHSHEHNLPNEHNKFLLIQTMRNPYIMLSSYFKAGRRNIDTSNKNIFYGFVHDIIYYNAYETVSRYNYSIRKPDYFIRLEHLFEDYSKIPFIRESELFKSGELKLKCKLPINKNIHNITPWQDLYTQETADLVYYNFSKIFNEMGYDKDSWKK